MPTIPFISNSSENVGRGDGYNRLEGQRRVPIIDFLLKKRRVDAVARTFSRPLPTPPPTPLQKEFQELYQRLITSKRED
jgi:hypothetical protein